MLAVLAVCAAPLIASYFTYYVIKPTSRTNYGELLDPRQYPMPSLDSSRLDGAPMQLQALHGKWIMLQVGPSDCNADCEERLTQMRQLRLMQGKEMDRVERVWLITDQAPLETMLLRKFDGTHMLRVATPQKLMQWLPVDSQNHSKIEDHIYMIDPLGNLMMRFPAHADPNKIKKDLSKLLKASKIG